jgi:purine-nucleoside phosphorylase
MPGMRAHFGLILTSDAFHDDDLDLFRSLGAAGTVAVEMETAAPCAMAARQRSAALCAATVPGHIVRHEVASAKTARRLSV